MFANSMAIFTKGHNIKKHWKQQMYVHNSLFCLHTSLVFNLTHERYKKMTKVDRCINKVTVPDACILGYEHMFGEQKGISHLKPVNWFVYNKLLNYQQIKQIYHT